MKIYILSPSMRYVYKYKSWSKLVVVGLIVKPRTLYHVVARFAVTCYLAFSVSQVLGAVLLTVLLLSNMPSVTLKDVDQHKFVKAFSAFLKKTGKMKVPEWVDIIKSAKFKELAPYDPDWYYIRCAALVRHIYIRSPIGVGAVTKIFGGRKRNGTHPSHFCRSAGGVARKALQSLEQLKLIEKTPTGGRKLTSQGRRDLDRIAAQVKAKSKKQLKLQETLVL